MAIGDLESAIAQVKERLPDARLRVSGIGNLAVIDGAGEMVGWIDMEDSSVNWTTSEP